MVYMNEFLWLQFESPFSFNRANGRLPTICPTFNVKYQKSLHSKHKWQRWCWCKCSFFFNIWSKFFSIFCWNFYPIFIILTNIKLLKNYDLIFILWDQKIIRKVSKIYVKVLKVFFKIFKRWKKPNLFPNRLRNRVFYPLLGNRVVYLTLLLS